ncbi:MAG: tetratricopeptide repeat protein [Polyangiaceae bacterium]
MAQELEPIELVPMLEKLVSRAAPNSRAGVFARQFLSELLVERNPWRAALLAKSVLQHDDDHRAWAVLGLAHTLLGHFRSAARAYARAIQLHPTCASYRHNLGHLLDVALNRPHAALLHLARAHKSAPEEDEIASSYAHALVRASRLTEARKVLEGVFRSDSPRIERLLARWQRPKAQPAPEDGASEEVSGLPPDLMADEESDLDQELQAALSALEAETH